MRKPLKITLSILASVVVLGLVTLVALPFVIDVNDFKAEIETAVQENTGRVLTIDGKINVSFFPWLGITTDKMTLSNAEGFEGQTFAKINQAQIKVKLMPLLFKKIEVSDIVLKGLSLNLLTNPQGKNNWDDLTALIENNPNQPKSPLKLLEIAGIFIKKAQIQWDNQQTGKKIAINKFNFTTEKLSFDKPVEIAFDFNAENPQLALTETLSFTGNLTLNEELDLFSLQKINLKLQTKHKQIPTGKLVSTLEGNASFDLKQQRLKFAPLNLKTGALTISSPLLTAWLEKNVKVEGTIHIPNFDAAEFMQQNLALQLPPMADEKALTWLAADFQLNVDSDHANLKNLEIQLDETTLKGALQINGFTKPAVNFNLASDTVNFDRYLPMPDKQKQRQSLPTPVGAMFATNASLLPIEALRKLNLNGQLTIADVKVKNLTMQGVRLLINAKDGFMQSLQSVNRFYQGAYNGKIVFDMRENQAVLTLNHHLSHIQLEPLLTDLNGQSQLAGLLDLNAKLEAHGNTDLALKSSLNGHLNFLGKEILLRGFNLQKVVDNGKILLGSSTLPSDNKKELTAFSKVTGSAIISNGILNNNDLSAIATKTKVNGLGVINLASQQLDYKIIAILLKEKMTDTHTKIVNNLPVFINIGGTFDAPAYQVDLAAMGVAL